MKKLAKTKEIFGLIRSFFSSDIAVYSGSMSFLTIFSFIPLLMLAFFIAVYIPFVQLNLGKLIDFLYTNMMSESAEIITTHIVDFLQNSKKLGAFGVVFAIYSSYMFIKQLDFCIYKLSNIEVAPFNLKRYLRYIAVIVIMTITLSLSALYQAVGVILDLESASIFVTYIQFALALFILYSLVSPIKRSSLKALYYAALYALIFIVFRKIFIFYTLYASSYTTIYGSFSVVFIFFLWLNFSWYLFFVSFKSYATEPLKKKPSNS